MPNPLNRYVEMAAGLTTVTVQAAERIVQRLVQEGEVAADRAERVVADVLEASERNRGELMELVRAEVDRAVERLNLATRGDLDAMEERLTGTHPAGRSPAAEGATADGAPRQSSGPPRRSPTRNTDGGSA